LPEIDGIQAAGPIWQKAMYMMHETPEFAALLVGPDGNPMPEEFPVPSDVEKRTLCEATGHRAGNGEEVQDWIVKGQEPSLGCGELDEKETDELTKALEQASKGNVSWANGAIASINEYARAANRQGVSDPDEEQEIEPIDDDDEDEDEDQEARPGDNENDDQVIEPRG
jgi:hypothetical protein